MYSWDLFYLNIANCTFFLTFDKINIDMTTSSYTALVFKAIHWYTSVFKWAESSTRSLTIREYILIVARKTTIWRSFQSSEWIFCVWQHSLDKPMVSITIEYQFLSTTDIEDHFLLNKTRHFLIKGGAFRC